MVFLTPACLHSLPGPTGLDAQCNTDSALVSIVKLNPWLQTGFQKKPGVGSLLSALLLSAHKTLLKPAEPFLRILSEGCAQLWELFGFFRPLFD